MVYTPLPTAASEPVITVTVTPPKEPPLEKTERLSEVGEIAFTFEAIRLEVLNKTKDVLLK